MDHRHSAQQANVIAEKCLDFLQKHELPSTPLNFAVAYELVLGKNEALAQAVRHLIEKKQVDTFHFKELYENHIENKNEMQDQVMGPVSQLLGNMLTYSAATTKSAIKYQNQLDQGSKALEESSNPQEILKALAQAAQMVSNEQKQLSERLNAAEKEVRALKTNLEQLEIEAITDPLSELSNRKGLEKTLEDQPADHPNNCIAIFDIDNFKSVNDNFGHNFGDYVIRQVAREIKNHIRGADIAVRWGGEEFLLVLRDTDLDGATFVGNKIREAIQALRWKNTRTGDQLPPVTISGGISQLQDGEDAVAHLDIIVDRADKCLYRAKDGGRNQVCI